MSNGQIGKGSSLSFAPVVSGAAGTYVPVAHMKDVVPPPRNIASAESTTFEDDSEQFIPGFINNGVAELEINTNDASTSVLFAMADGVTTFYWKITLSNTHTWTFPGFIENYTPNVPMKQVMTDRLKVKLQGKAVYA
jgi:hypothetical protein